MDFSTIQKKLRSKAYCTGAEVLSDVLRIFDNCKLYNEPSTVFYKLAEKMNKAFVKEVKSMSSASAAAAAAAAAAGNGGGGEACGKRKSGDGGKRGVSNGGGDLYPIFNSGGSKGKEEKEKKKKRKRSKSKDQHQGKHKRSRVVYDSNEDGEEDEDEDKDDLYQAKPSKSRVC